MGGYTTYEVDMAEFVDWDDSDVEELLEPYTELGEQHSIITVYS